MAQDQDRTTAGGNKPKPANGPGSAGQSAKDRRKAQSRSISTKSPAGKGGKPGAKPGPGGKGGAGGKGGNTPRSGARPAPAAPKRRASGALIAWGAVGLIVVVIAVLVIVKLTAGSTNNANAPYTPVTPAPASVVHDVTNIPLSVYNTVGVTSPTQGPEQRSMWKSRHGRPSRSCRANLVFVQVRTGNDRTSMSSMSRSA